MGAKTVRNYLHDLYKRPIANEEINTLCHSAQCGDLLAVSRLVQAHQKLVRLVADKYADQGLGELDLQYTGIIGLIKAIHRYHKGREADFKTYAVWWIKQSILKAIEEEKRIREVAQFDIKAMDAIPGSFKLWELRFQKDPNAAEIDAMLNTSLVDVGRLSDPQPEIRYQWLPKA